MIFLRESRDTDRNGVQRSARRFKARMAIRAESQATAKATASTPRRRLPASLPGKAAAQPGAITHEGGATVPRPVQRLSATRSGPRAASRAGAGRMEVKGKALTHGSRRGFRSLRRRPCTRPRQHRAGRMRMNRPHVRRIEGRARRRPSLSPAANTGRLPPYSRQAERWTTGRNGLTADPSPGRPSG